MLNKNLDDLIGLKKEKVLPENDGNNMGLANRFGKFFDDKTNNIYKSLQMKIPEIYNLCPNK